MTVTLERARSMIDAGLAHARSAGHSVSIAVVDSGGYLVAAARMDRAPLLSPEIAFGKAAASALFRTPSGDLGARWPPGAPIPVAMTVRLGGRFIAQQGALPIRQHDEVVGAVGVSGAPSSVDEEIAIIAVGSTELRPDDTGGR